MDVERKDDPANARKRTAVLGKGGLAIQILDWFHRHADYDLAAVVPVLPEPEWAPRVREHVRSHDDLSDVRVLEHHEELEGHWDVIFSCFYDKILPRELLDRCKLALNIHAAPLPRHRGMRPINWALKEGDREGGVTIHEMLEGVDNGSIYGQVKFTIWPEFDEVRDVYERMLRYAWPLFVDTMTRIDGIVPQPQNESEATMHTSAESALLGERSGWTRAESRSHA